MKTVTIDQRPATARDAQAIVTVHDAAWRAAYQGIIPSCELDKIIARRGPVWWENALDKGNRISLLLFGEKIVGYANYGKNRAAGLPQQGEIYEIYLLPEFQGLGLGTQFFNGIKRDLAQSSLKTLVVWVLSENEMAVSFYKSLGGRPIV
jgi:ribosomal protein S18 acetylase RimI-like enzyme